MKLAQHRGLIKGRALEVEPGHLSFRTRTPIGVAGIIAPFNSPLVLAVRSLAPALAAGVTTVIKLPGNTAQTNCMFSQVLAEVADLPHGVINIFSESGSDGSSLLVELPDHAAAPRLRNSNRDIFRSRRLASPLHVRPGANIF